MDARKWQILGLKFQKRLVDLLVHQVDKMNCRERRREVGTWEWRAGGRPIGRPTAARRAEDQHRLSEWSTPRSDNGVQSTSGLIKKGEFPLLS